MSALLTGSVVEQEEGSLEIEQYLHRRIPLTAAMGARVRIATPARVELAAPLGPNINHQDSVFGGSAAALATLSAWLLVTLRLKAEDCAARIVVQRSVMSFEESIRGDFIAVCDTVDEAQWQRFRTLLRRRGQGRITVRAQVLHEQRPMASFEGDFVAIRD